MLGWHISIYRQTDEGASPATSKSPEGKCLVAWTTGLDGLDWINELVKNGEAIDLGGSGYPCRYTATVKNLFPSIEGFHVGRGRDPWAKQESGSLIEKSAWRTILEDVDISSCRSDEWLLVEAWDGS